MLGFTADEQSRLQWDAAGVKLADGQSVLRDGNDPDAAFRFGLTVLIRGLNVQGAAAQSHAESTTFRRKSSSRSRQDVDPDVVGRPAMWPSEVANIGELRKLDL